jgi:hypothetical protein
MAKTERYKFSLSKKKERRKMKKNMKLSQKLGLLKKKWEEMG